MNKFIVFTLVVSSLGWAVRPDLKNLPIGLATFEKNLQREGERPPQTDPPHGPIRSLAEWETSQGVMTLWTNPSLLRALSNHGPVKILADTRGDKDWWLNYLRQNGINSAPFSFYEVETDSIWVRDYGPWFILDGDGMFGLIDTKYNRPRPNDDQVPLFIAQQLGVPYYQPGLVHTGGNYYNDALGNAFSSTLVYTENSSLSKAAVNERMSKYLGIERYTTSPLSPGLTIEHMDTFGKLVAPDTWVFSEFPAGSPHKKDSDQMVALLKTLKSPYGTPYKIHRMKMYSSGGGDYRAYINSFISNGALYFPTYGAASDEEARAVYQKALPSYDIVGVDSMGTTWGDSVHCRTRNLLTNETVFIFPRLERTLTGVELTAEVFPSPGSVIAEDPEVHWSTDAEEGVVKMQRTTGRHFHHVFAGLKTGTTLKLWISAKDTAGFQKTAPNKAPAMQIEMKIE